MFNSNKRLSMAQGTPAKHVGTVVAKLLEPLAAVVRQKPTAKQWKAQLNPRPG